MSRFRDKAADIRAAGEAQRGNFEPSGAPKRLYNYWLEESNSKKARAIKFGSQKENFCHFWRVVAIWAPLFFIGNKFLDVAEHKATTPIFVALVLFTVLGMPVIFGGLEAVLVLLATFALALAIIAVGVGIAYLTEKHPRQAMIFGKWFGSALVTGAIIGALVLFIMWTGFAGVVILTVGAVLGLVVRLNIERISDYIHYRRDLRQKREDEQGEALRKAYDAYLNGEGQNPHARKVRPPNAFERKMAAFGRGVADFIIMIAQVVRVNKWKICPLVEVDTK